MKKFSNNNFECHVNPNFDKTVDEGANSKLSLRLVSWGGNPEKLELRRWYTGNNGEEKAGKGCTFITERGPGILAVALLESGFGDTAEVINSIKNREDFNISMRRALTDDDLNNIKNSKVPNLVNDPDYYDPMTIFAEESFEEMYD